MRREPAANEKGRTRPCEKTFSTKASSERANAMVASRSGRTVRSSTPVRVWVFGSSRTARSWCVTTAPPQEIPPRRRDPKTKTTFPSRIPCPAGPRLETRMLGPIPIRSVVPKSVMSPVKSTTRARSVSIPSRSVLAGVRIALARPGT